MRMRNEEAIKIIGNYDMNGCGYCHQGGEEIKEAFDLAIKSLEAWDKVIEIIHTNREHTKGTSEFGQGKIYGLDIAEEIIDRHLREVEE